MSQPSDPAARAAALLASQPAFDAHTDALQRQLDLGHDLGTVTPGQFDLVRAKRGGLGSVVLVCWVDPAFEPDGSAARARALMQAGRELAAGHPDKLRLCRTNADLDAAHAGGQVAGFLGIEGGHALENSMEQLERLAEEGLRCLTLVWNNHLPWIRSCMPDAGADIPEGLSPFGRDIVKRMHQLGVMVDLSHAGERSFYDALEVAERPMIASHSGCKALHDHPRNLDDAQLKALGAAGGVVGIVFHPGFLDADARAEEMRVRKLPAYRAIEDDGSTKNHLAHGEIMQREAAPLAIERVAEHIEHAMELAGPQSVGIGSDFDGIERGPVGLEEATGYVRMAECLLGRGMDPEHVAGVLGGNMQRAFSRCLP
ncbi:MAG: dipeptidase [Planctomycetota bacterium]|jgi:membrane dipeptidase